MPRFAFLILRVSVGVVFLIFGIGKFRNDIWAQTIKTMDFMLKLPWDVSLTVFLIGILETVTGGALILGLFPRIFSSLAAAELFGILALLNFQEVRDIGLLGAAVYMSVVKDESLSIHALWKKHKGDAK